MQDHELDDLFAQARITAPPPSEALMLRVLADADLHQPRPASRPAAPRIGFLASLLAGLGGGGALAGLATATLAGFYIGFVQPSSVAALTETIWRQDMAELALDSVELIPDLDSYLPEG